ncbi:MAG: 30S ribosomal protein S16 [Calditrichia bacterium]
MAVKLRLRRLGRKKRPFYRLVAADSRSPRDGRFIEEIGYYNPLTHPATVELNEERAMYWLGVGAIPTKTVKNILSRKGLILKMDLQKKGLSEDKIQEELKKWEVLQLERMRRLEAEQTQKKAGEAAKEEAAAPEAPQAEEPESPKAEKTEAPKTEERETPKAEETETPAETESVETETEASKDQDTEAEAEKKEE